MFTKKDQSAFISRLLCIALVLVSIFSSYSHLTVYGWDESNHSRGATQLNPLEKYVYDELSAEIKKIAEGNRESATIIVDLTDKINNKPFTAKDLGLDSLMDSSNNYLSEIDGLAIEKAIGSFDPIKISSCLQSDAPYELYWFDKTIGCYWYYNGRTRRDMTTISVTDVKYVFRFVVTSDYSTSGERGTLSVNTSKAKNAAKVLTKAKSIVSAASGKSDYDKLLYYRDQICALTSYDYQAAKMNADYGNPFQLINVFDGDSSTKVTCEGYSKAFKLLCDLTTFNSPDISCSLVVGTTTEDHMWNVVRMDDGRNYLVDITSCDSSQANRDAFFLKGDPKGTSNRYSIKASDGTLVYQYGSDTLMLFNAKERTLHTGNYEKQHVHQYGAWTKLNDTQHRRVCKEDSSHVEVANHTWDAGKVTKAATSTSSGVKTYTCSVCKGTKNEVIPVVVKESVKWKRLYGDKALDTMESIINEGIEDGKFKPGGTVIIATAGGFHDALAAAGLAGRNNAAVVLTHGKQLKPQTTSVLKALNPSKVYIAGGEGAISEAVENAINRTTGKKAERLAGDDAAETSAKMALAANNWSTDRTAIIATNGGFHDALAAAPIAYAKGYPILLASKKGTTLKNPVKNALKTMGIEKIIIVGGEGAVSEDVEKELIALGIKNIERLEGETAIETSARIAEWGLTHGMTPNCMGIATSASYYDALSGAALCGANNSVLVLEKYSPDVIPKRTNTGFPSKYRALINKAYVFGGTAAVTEVTWNRLVETIG